MKFLKKTLPFILLNVFVTAATLLTVLYFWQQKKPMPNAEPTQPISPLSRVFISLLKQANHANPGRSPAAH